MPDIDVIRDTYYCSKCDKYSSYNSITSPDKLLCDKCKKLFTENNKVLSETYYTDGTCVRNEYPKTKENTRYEMNERDELVFNFFLLLILIFCLLGFLYTEEKYPVASGIILLFSLVIIVASSAFLRNHTKELERKRAKIKMQEIESERLYAEQCANSNAPWNRRYFTEPCPYCGHYKVRYSNWDDKRMSVAFWGVWSDKVGKSFHCEYCKKDFNN